MSLPADIRELLADLAGGKTVSQAAADAEVWRGSADLNEERLSDLALRAAELLEKYPPAGPPEGTGT